MIKAAILAILSFGSLSWSFQMKDALETARNIGRENSEIKLHSKQIQSFYLYNHKDNLSKKDYSTQKVTERYNFFKLLIEYLTNDQMGSVANYEYVNQTENDNLLKLIVKDQLKQGDLIQIYKDYESLVDDEIKKRIPLDTESKKVVIDEIISDGKRVISAFISVQSRIEEIESNRLDFKSLAPDLKKAYSGITFKCFYSLYSKENLEKFKRQTIQAQYAFIQEKEADKLFRSQTGRYYSDEEWKLIKDFKSSFLKSTSQSIEVVKSEHLSEKELNDIIDTSWRERIIIARCLRNSLVLDHKEKLMEHYSQRLETNNKNYRNVIISQEEMDSILNIESIKDYNTYLKLESKK